MFKFSLRLCLLLPTLLITPNAGWSFSPIHHQLRVELEPSTRFARIEDTIQLAKGECGPFYLHSNLKLAAVPAGWQVETSSDLLKITWDNSGSSTCPTALTLNYSGILHDPSPDPDNPEDSNGFFFSGESYFYPQHREPFSRITFEMRVFLPKPWQVVSQGKKTSDQLSETKRIVFWQSSQPSEEIYLIGNKFHIYEAEHNGLSLYAFLLQEEKELAERYLETAKGYIDFYSRLIGPYPYEKFALIENSRQTGYGMPSFTLMGSRIIRFPFILHSSYPHEILHNWWGNGVFPDPEQGNWSEGLTAYLADHLLLELKGKGAPYRFQEMMKFSNYVHEGNDFPLSAFTYRDSMASQAIGYGKLLMVLHMLRTEVGDENFLQGLKKFYASFKYRYAGYEEMRKNFEEVSGQDLSKFFEQWIKRKGAPEIQLQKASYVSLEGRYDLRLTVEQSDPAFKLKLPVAIWTTGFPVGEIYHIELSAGRQNFNFQLSAEPVAVRLDPYNDVFRRLGVEEAPASLSQTYGAQTVTALLPENQGYEKFAQSVAKQIITTAENPPEGGLWVFGKAHPLSKAFVEQLKKLGVLVTEKGVLIQDKSYPWDNHSFVFTLNRMDGKTGTMTWVVSDKAESIPGLIRKLPHYGKYGYLVFEGTAPDNLDKGTWPSNPAGLQKVFKDGGPLLLPEQKPLVSFKPFE
jgi:hypothetical protein